MTAADQNPEESAPAPEAPPLPSWARLVSGKPDGEFYDASDAEELSSGSLEEEVSNHLEGWDTDFWPETVEVRVLSRMDPAMNAHRYALSLLETLLDDIEEDFGDPGGYHEALSAEKKAECLAIMENAVERVCANHQVYMCDRVGLIEVDVLEYVRQEEPGWLDDPDVKKWLEKVAKPVAGG